MTTEGMHGPLPEITDTAHILYRVVQLASGGACRTRFSCHSMRAQRGNACVGVKAGKPASHRINRTDHIGEHRCLATRCHGYSATLQANDSSAVEELCRNNRGAIAEVNARLGFENILYAAANVFRTPKPEPAGATVRA